MVNVLGVRLVCLPRNAAHCSTANAPRAQSPPTGYKYGEVLGLPSATQLRGNWAVEKNMVQNRGRSVGFGRNDRTSTAEDSRLGLHCTCVHVWLAQGHQTRQDRMAGVLVVC